MLAMAQDLWFKYHCMFFSFSLSFRKEKNDVRNDLYINAYDMYIKLPVFNLY